MAIVVATKIYVHIYHLANMGLWLAVVFLVSMAVLVLLPGSLPKLRAQVDPDLFLYKYSHELACYPHRTGNMTC
jgi:hypothetical protein